MNLDNSFALWERAQGVLAGGPATLSKHPARFAYGVSPIFLDYGDGYTVTDVDDNTYLDMIGALGPILLGYNNLRVNDAVKIQVRKGVSFSLPHRLEVEVAELLCAMIPCAEQVRFCKNGADATQAAVRVARRETGRQHVLCSSYHGHHDWYIASTDKRGGILPVVSEYTHQFQWGDIDAFCNLLAEFSGDVAAVIVEVPPGKWATQAEDAQKIQQFLRGVQLFAEARGIVFILDEVVTGFRYHEGGAQALYHVTPDLACIGKGMANGYPLAAVCGRRDLMHHFEDGEVFLSTTNGGEAVSLAAAKATLQQVAGGHVVPTIHEVGTKIGNALERVFALFNLPVELWGTPARMVLKWLPAGDIPLAALKTLWLQETVTRGILFGVPIFPTVAMHTPLTGDMVTNRIETVAGLACATIRQAIDEGDVTPYLRCPVVEDVFDRRLHAEEQKNG